MYTTYYLFDYINLIKIYVTLLGNKPRGDTGKSANKNCNRTLNLTQNGPWVRSKDLADFTFPKPFD